MATGAELEIVLMVMLGGTYIFGGRGNVFGTFVAFWIVVILRAGFNVARIKIESQLTILGAPKIVNCDSIFIRATLNPARNITTIQKATKVPKTLPLPPKI